SNTMSVVALSPVAPEPASPMLTSVTPVTPNLDPSTSSSLAAITVPPLGLEPQSKKPPPLHTGADWKVVLHLPEIEKWLRATSDRVTQLTHSVGQDSNNRHVDVHLVQLKDICEDISDHVEQIHALLETEFSLKLLSYSVNIIVDIRTVQLLWHQLRVSVLVLKERLLQSLQDSNGNYTRQTDILQAFSQDQHQVSDTQTNKSHVLDALLFLNQVFLSSKSCLYHDSVYDCGQLTIRCSQDYFSLDCGITAFELSDYSPSDEPEVRVADDSTNHNPSSSILLTMQCGMPNHNESAKRPLQGEFHSTEVSPTQPSLPKRAAMFLDGASRAEDSVGGSEKVSPVSGIQFQSELSRSTPSLISASPPDRSKFWLELDSVYPENVSQSCESLQVCPPLSFVFSLHEHKELQKRGSAQRLLPDQRSSSGARPTADAPLPLQDLKSQNETSNQMERMQKETHTHSEGDSDSSLPSPMREQALSSDLEASGEESDPRPPLSSKGSPDREHWYGSEEFLALPAQLRKTEMLAMKLESLTQTVPLRPGGSTQDVDDWDLTELNPDWDVTRRRNLLGRFSPSSSSDVAPSLDESIESGPLSDLQSEEDEGRRSAEHQPPLTLPPLRGRECASLVQQLLEDILSHDKDPDIWKKIEYFVQQLDGFISWLQEALDSTENWIQPRQDLDSLRVYLDTHLSFKLNVDSRAALKESIMEEGKALLTIITFHHSGLKDILHMVSSQWDQLQRQIRRQHSWMLRALRCIQARLLYTNQLHEPFTAPGDPSANCQCEAQRMALEQMAIKLSSLQYPSPTNRRPKQTFNYNSLTLSSLSLPFVSLQEFEAEYQELWDWLMDMDAMVTDSHQLMLSEEQRHHLFKVNMRLMLLPNIQPKILSKHSGPGRSEQNQSSNIKAQLAGGRGVTVENPRSALSPLTNSLLEQLEARIKELKAWLRDTELLIFNSCLRQDKDASEQLQSFKPLCSDIQARRRGVSSVLKLCQKLLQQSQALQLLSINLERRWEAIVMQALQWQNRLKRELGEQQVRAYVTVTHIDGELLLSHVPDAHLPLLGISSRQSNEVSLIAHNFLFLI
uniref:A kinase (PRKA) anchor protein 6 n=1 Tax=Maylandia zebra TaxID=106582 RepID=A0A3P9AUS2_9CICH